MLCENDANMAPSILTSATKTLCCIFFLDFIIRTIAASISCFLSSSTFCLVSFLSGSDSPCLAATKIKIKVCVRRNTLKIWLTRKYNIIYYYSEKNPSQLEYTYKLTHNKQAFTLTSIIYFFFFV